MRVTTDELFVLAVLVVASCAGSGRGESRIASPSRSPRALPGTLQAVVNQPPADLRPDQVPQFVIMSFDDGFGLEAGGVGGVNDIVAFGRSHTNPAGSGNAATFDGSPVRMSFYLTSTNGEDPANRAAWTEAFRDGHEIGNHSVTHPNGGDILSGTVLGRHFDEAQWTTEIEGCTAALSGSRGIGARAGDIAGFRAPYLSYNDATFRALDALHFAYDSSIPNCFGGAENGSNCSWPYLLDHGSRDADVLTEKFRLPALTSHPGLWEVPVTTLFIPPDDLAMQYGFEPGLLDRIPPNMPFPSLFDRHGRNIAGLDATLLPDANLTPEEMTAVLEYNLDLHLAGNRAPLVFIAHTYMYSFSSPQINDNTASLAIRDARWEALTRFLTYALTKPDVRIRPTTDMLAWMRHPVALER
jgi:hypothetical protein